MSSDDKGCGALFKSLSGNILTCGEVRGDKCCFYCLYCLQRISKSQEKKK